MKSLIISAIAITCLFISCANIKMLTPEDIYSKDFLQQMDKIQAIYKKGNKDSALAELEKLNDSSLSKAELGKKLNFLGIISFSEGDFSQASEYFFRAKDFIRLDEVLAGQTRLNLASAYYKMDKYEKAFNTIETIDPKVFTEEEKKKYHKLRLALAEGENAHKAVVSSLIYLLKDKKLFSEINQSEQKNLLMDSFRKLSGSERVFLLEKHDEQEAVVIPFLAAEEALQRYYFGDRAGAEDVLEWLESNFGEYEDVQNFVSDFQYRIENFSKVDVGAVGVVLPLSGDKERFGKKALMGIDTALNRGEDQLASTKLYTRDNKNNPTVAKKLVHDLIQKHHVSVIIGGLFPSTAKEEYLEARKYGALFISLSPVYLEKEEKNHLLIEIPGSVQSQVATIFSEDFLAKNGNNIAMIYPDSEGGLAYVNEVWRKAKEGKINIKSLASFDKNVKDYREWVQKLLGLKYTRERSEEFELWKEIYSLERKNSSIRRIQTLRPIVDFDWVFVPSYPHEALQIIPSFTYFDAKGLKYVGGPSWMSRKLVKEQRNLGSLRFVGDDPDDFDKSFVSVFSKRNKSNPSLVETLAFEGMNLALNILEDSKFDKREELERKLVNMQLIDGITGQWKLDEGIWLKDLDILKIQNNDIKKVELEMSPANKKSS
ncbi:MAG: hypothetical protein CME67_01795 [Halobacteriovoraceae bacterium]|nr:hypothetical protein [Halobacteriovoraceae bacterium]|tara:strand:+ start:5158 stop:7128 length:1971 start_codon:yes stop_codon:yes gene_type:complete